MSFNRSKPTPAIQTPCDFTVATYNLNCFAFNNGRAPLNQNELNTIDGIRATNADLVFLQETHKRWEQAIRDHAPEYTTLLFRHSQASDGIGVIAKHGIQVEEVDHLYPEVEGAWFAGHITRFKKDKEWIYVINVHLRPPKDNDGYSFDSYFNTGHVRRGEVQYLYNHLKKKYDTNHILIVGDFNEGHNGAGVKWLKGGTVPKSNNPKMTELYDSFSDALYDLAGGAHTWSWPALWKFSYWAPYDHIFYSNQTLEAITCKVLLEYDWVKGPKHGSDHMPVVAQIKYK
jgi:endonuclease/exonuclease/phosphatase family metal-dependent hydrolase